MAISPPSIYGGLSPISTSARLLGQIAGGTISIFRNGVDRIAHRPAVAADQVFDFEPGVVLQPRDKITAIQEFGGQPSAPTPIPTEVQELVPPFGGHRFISHIFRCGTSLFLAGIVPGAEVHLFANGTFRGKSKSVDGGAIVEMVDPTGPNEIIEARQLVQGSFGPSVFSHQADQPPSLFAFNIDTPRACLPGIQVRGVIDGATVRVRTDRDDPLSEIVFHVPVSERFLFLPPLTAGQKLRVQERMERCELWGPELNPDVLPMTFERRPTIKGPLCAGTTRVEIANLVPGAIVVATQGATEVGRAQAMLDTMDIWVSPLAPGVDLVITETLCGVSASSFSEPVKTLPQSPPACVLVRPLFACAMQLSLENVHPGAYVCAFSQEKGQISGWQRIPGKEGILHLFAPLQADHHVHVKQVACGGTPTDSNEVQVERIVDLAPPVLEAPIFADRPVAWVRNAVPGALVQLYSREQGYISSAVADTSGRAALPKGTIYGTVIAGHHLRARQLLCDQVSGFSDDEPVVDRTPLAPVITEPLVGATNVHQRPALRWKDPGAGTVRQASGFLVEMTHASNPQFNGVLMINEVVNGTTHLINQDLPLGANLIWRVTAFVGDPGFEVRSPSAVGNFTVFNPTPPPVQGFSKVAIFNCHTSNRSLKVYHRDVTANGAWSDGEDIGTQYANGACPVGSPRMEIELTEAHTHHIIAVDIGAVGCTGDKVDEPACQRDQLIVLGDDDGPVKEYVIA